MIRTKPARSQELTNTHRAPTPDWWTPARRWKTRYNAPSRTTNSRQQRQCAEPRRKRIYSSRRSLGGMTRLYHGSLGPPLVNRNQTGVRIG